MTRGSSRWRCGNNGNDSGFEVWGPGQDDGGNDGNRSQLGSIVHGAATGLVSAGEVIQHLRANKIMCQLMPLAVLYRVSAPKITDDTPLMIIYQKI